MFNGVFFIKLGLIAMALHLLSGCASYRYPSQVELDKPLITATGKTLDGTAMTIPADLLGQPALLIFGYVHKSQFDIDRWLIGLDMTKVNIAIYELPAIKSPIAGLFSNRFDDSMRDGIPKELWSDVITVYTDGDKIQRYTGNIVPKNARVLLIDKTGIVKHFYDRGFSVDALNQLNASIAAL